MYETPPERFGRARGTFRGLLIFASVPTSIAGLWLLIVTTTVLPARDPAHVQTWAAVMLGCFGLVGLSAAYLRAATPGTTLRSALITLSLAALAFGLYAIASMTQAPASRFEGYVLLIGAILAGHGLAGLLSGISGMRSARARAAVIAPGRSLDHLERRQRA